MANVAGSVLTLVIVQFARSGAWSVVRYGDLRPETAEWLIWAGTQIEDLSFCLDVARETKGS